jgi:hypothetical protein
LNRFSPVHDGFDDYLCLFPADYSCFDELAELLGLFESELELSGGIFTDESQEKVDQIREQVKDTLANIFGYDEIATDVERGCHLYASLLGKIVHTFFLQLFILSKHAPIAERTKRRFSGGCNVIGLNLPKW